MKRWSGWRANWPIRRAERVDLARRGDSRERFSTLKPNLECFWTAAEVFRHWRCRMVFDIKRKFGVSFDRREGFSTYAAQIYRRRGIPRKNRSGGQQACRVVIAGSPLWDSSARAEAELCFRSACARQFPARRRMDGLRPALLAG